MIHIRIGSPRPQPLYRLSVDVRECAACHLQRNLERIAIVVDVFRIEGVPEWIEGSNSGCHQQQRIAREREGKLSVHLSERVHMPNSGTETVRMGTGVRFARLRAAAAQRPV